MNQSSRYSILYPKEGNLNFPAFVISAIYSKKNRENLTVILVVGTHSVRSAGSRRNRAFSTLYRLRLVFITHSQSVLLVE